jgi:hypothetical protein
MKDWLKFLRLYTHGSSGSFSLSSATLTKLSSPYMLPDRTMGPSFNAPADQGDPTYGFGWGIANSSSAGPYLRHDGTYFRFYAKAEVYLNRDFAIAAATNIEGGEGAFPGDNIVSDLRNYMVGRASTDCN